jgi:hypothetical protein
MVRMPLTIIFLHHGEVPICVVMLFQRGSSSTNLSSVKSSLEPPTIFIALLSSY